MSMYKGRSKKVRIALGAAGFFVLVAGTPCILGIYGDTQGGPEDTVGLFGVAGSGLLVLFVGVTLLYQAFKSDDSSIDEQ